MKILVIGAHPDDCEFYAGGTAVLWRRRRDAVRFVSMTNGDAGHFELRGEELARRRRAEALAAARVADVEYEILDTSDGQLEPTLERRMEVIRLIRKFVPDLVLTHRPGDYHPDHRYTSILVQDAAYMVTVPPICADTPHLRENPVFGYLCDAFQKPAPFRADAVVDVDPVVELKWDMLDAHASQFYEWLPYNDGTTDEVPESGAERRQWLRERWGPLMRSVADAHRGKLLETYGEEAGKRVRHAEAFEISEYGSVPAPADLARLFPF